MACCLAPKLSAPPLMQANRFLVLFLTFMCYTAYHASRRPLSIVKSVLHGEPSGGANSAHLEVTWTASNIGGRQGWGGGLWWGWKCAC